MPSLPTSLTRRPLPPQSRRSASKSATRSLGEAIRTLHAHQHGSVQEALRKLSELATLLQLAPLFHQIFPRQYRHCLRTASQITPLTIAQTLCPQFIDLISRHYFPIDVWDPEDLLQYFPQIPVSVINYDAESEFESEPLPVNIAAHLVGAYSNAPSREDLAGLLPHIRLPQCWKNPSHYCEITYPAFHALCQRYPAPIRTFPELYLTFTHDTGNIFFDLSYDWQFEHDYQWNTESLTALKHQWDLAKPILKQNARTIRQLERHPEHWQAIFTCWEHACAAMKEEPYDAA